MSVTMPWKAPADNPVNGTASKIDTVRHALSREADHLAEMADDATTQAAKIAKDTGSGVSSAATEQVGRANTVAADLAKAAVGLGTALALSSKKTAQDLGDNAQSVAKDLRNVRITTEPKKSGPDFMPGITLLAGFGAGLALMYFLDPERGRARRNVLRDKLTSWTRRATATVQETSKQIQGQMMRTADSAESQAETQIWPAVGGDVDGSTTDTWGEQPQASVPGSSSIS